MGNAESTVRQASFALIWSRKVVSFLCVCALVYALMMGLWAVWGDAYLRLYCAGANQVFGSLGSRATVYFSQSADTGDEVKVTFYDRQRLDRYLKPTPLLRIAHDVRYGVYIYVAFLVALIIASPVAWRRRARALLWGLIAVHAFMAIRLALLVAQLLNSKSIALLELTRFWQYLLVLSVQVFVINILPSFVVVIVLWVLLCFRRQDWPTIMMPQKRSRTIHPKALRAPP